MMGSSCVLLLVLISIHICSCNYVSSDNFGEQKFDNVKVHNNNWGVGAPKQTLKAQNGGSWCVESSAGDSGGIKSYPNSAIFVNRTLQSLKKIDSTFGGKSTTASQGKLAFSFSYDIWCENHKYEIMLWMHSEGEICPIGKQEFKLEKVAGHNWEIWRGSNGQNEVFSFINKPSTFAGSIDIKAILDWIVTKSWMSNSVLVDEVQLGFEITSSPKQTNFCLTCFTCTFQ